MKFFEKFYPDINFDVGVEVKVKCPFHDDTKPSASVNTEKSAFYCHVCGVGYGEQEFIAHANEITPLDASKVLASLNDSSLPDWEYEQKAQLWSDNNFLNSVKETLHLSEETIELANLGLVKDDRGRKFLGVPVLYNGALMDVRRYNLFKYESTPKIMSNKGADSGWIIPYDIWRRSEDPTYIFEGEKDMLIAREHGINGITLTGGATAKPNEFVIHAFKDREIIICYDNDDAGRKGADNLYLSLKSIAKSVHFVRIGDLVKENKEDLFDFFTKYDGDVFDFYMLEMHEFSVEEEVIKYDSIKEALQSNKIKRSLKSKVVISSEFADSYAVPESASLIKVEEGKGKNESMFAGEQRNWVIDLKNPQNLLELIELAARKHEVNDKLKQWSGIGKEPGVSVNIKNYRTIYKTRIADTGSDGNSLEIDLYSFSKVMVGKQYEIDYKIYPHPTKNQKLVAISEHVKSLDDLSAFKPDKAKLAVFKQEGTIEERLKYLYESAKHHVAKHLSYDIWLMNDLTFNSVLEIDYGDRIRGALDVFILGDTQVGKSETAQRLTELYEFGHFLSLKTSTVVGLIGGSNKVEGSWMNTVGAIPRQHKRLAVLEEFSGADRRFIKTMTDVRSSGKLRLARASGEMEVDCRLRMISISNPINDVDGTPRELSTFPNGVLPIMELISSAEDVSRYDAFLLAPKPKKLHNPFGQKLNGYKIPKELYHHKIMWVATRSPEDVVFVDDSDSYIWERAQELNKMFESNFTLFTTTTSQKLARISVAMASLLMNTDSKFTEVRVTKEIVDYVFDWLVSIYDNPVFKLREYKEEFDSYNTCTASDVSELNKLYPKHATMLETLSKDTDTSQSNLSAISGLERDKFTLVFNKLVALKMVRLRGAHVYPTRKFMDAMQRVDRSFTINTGDFNIDKSADIFKEVKPNEGS